MNKSTTLLFVLLAYSSGAAAFLPQPTATAGVVNVRIQSKISMGYLDDMNKYVGTAEEEEEEDDSREATALAPDKRDRAGVGDWSTYVEFDEFDGGDGQMGVAGDGEQGLQKEWSKTAEMGQSKMRSSRNAWGTSSGYADDLRAQGVETSRAQQLENWHNQQEVLQSKRAARFMTDEFDSVSADESWRDLSKFGVERNQDFDLDATFGPVQPGEKLEGTIELQSRINRNEVYDFQLKNNFMGFSDFRAAFAAPNNGEWSVEPSEGSISGREATEFVVKYRPSTIGVSETYLVIDTEDDKWTWKCTGTGSM